MKRIPPSLLVLAAAAPFLAASAAVLWFWITIPPEPDPAALPAQALAPPAEAWTDAVARGRLAARTAVSREKLPGLSVAVAVDGALVWAEAFGWSDLETRAPATPATLYRIGGISGAVTAAAAGLLAERGRLDLDAPVRQVVPGFVTDGGPVTVYRLLSHTAGLRGHRGEEEMFGAPHCAGDAERLAIFADDPLRFPPGSDVAYSPYGLTLAGIAVAAAAEEPFVDFARREVLAPLGMESTVPDGGAPPSADVARFYYPRMMLNPRYGLQDAPETDLSCILPAAGYLATAPDVARLGAGLIDGVPLDAATVEELWAPATLELPLGPRGEPLRIVGAGLGATVRRRPLSAVSVGGHVPGSTAILVLVPERRVAVAAATNVTGSEGLAELALRLAEEFLAARPPTNM